MPGALHAVCQVMASRPTYSKVPVVVITNSSMVTLELLLPPYVAMFINVYPLLTDRLLLNPELWTAVNTVMPPSFPVIVTEPLPTDKSLWDRYRYILFKVNDEAEEMVN